MTTTSSTTTKSSATTEETIKQQLIATAAKKSKGNLNLFNHNIKNEGCSALVNLLRNNLPTAADNRNNDNDNDNNNDNSAAMPPPPLQQRNEIKITHLDLGNNQIGDDGCRIVSLSLLSRNNNNSSGSSSSSLLRYLDLSGNSEIGIGGWRFLSHHGLRHNGALKTLKLRSNNIGDEGCIELAGGLLHSTALEELNLGDNHIGDQGCAALSGCCKQPGCRLAVLELDDNRIGDTGCTALAEALTIAASSSSPQRLRDLNLEYNIVRGRGCTALGRALAATQQSIAYLNLQQNDLGNDSHDTITECLCTFRDALKTGNNTTLRDLKFTVVSFDRDTLRLIEEIKFYVKLNTLGRSRILLPTTAKPTMAQQNPAVTNNKKNVAAADDDNSAFDNNTASPATRSTAATATKTNWDDTNQWIDILVGASEDMECLFYFLALRPDLCDNNNNNKPVTRNSGFSNNHKNSNDDNTTTTTLNDNNVTHDNNLKHRFDTIRDNVTNVRNNNDINENCVIGTSKHTDTRANKKQKKTTL